MHEVFNSYGVEARGKKYEIRIYGGDGEPLYYEVMCDGVAVVAKVRAPDDESEGDVVNRLTKTVNPET